MFFKPPRVDATPTSVFNCPAGWLQMEKKDMICEVSGKLEISYPSGWYQRFVETDLSIRN